MIVNRHHLEASLERVRARTRNPAAGIHGPGSTAWQLQKEAVVFLGSLRAALLQLAHPYVAYAIDQHSKTRTDVQGRFQRTFMNVFAMVYGDLDTALAAARTVHRVHTRINGVIPADVGPFKAGHRYHANESSALLWVYATLVHTVIEVHGLVLGPLSAATKDAYYRDSTSFALLFGIPLDELPADYPGFEDYVQRMLASDTLTVSEPALDMSKFLLVPPRPALAPVTQWMKLLTATMLPERLRAGFELPLSAADRLLVRSSLRAFRPLYRATPRRLRYVPAYVEARRRIAGRSPSRTSAWLERLAMLGLRGSEPEAVAPQGAAAT